MEEISVEIRNEPWCDGCGLRNLVIKESSLCADGGVFETSYFGQCSHLGKCRGAVERARALDQQAVADSVRPGVGRIVYTAGGCGPGPLVAGGPGVHATPKQDHVPPKRTTWDVIKELPKEKIARWLTVNVHDCPPNMLGVACDRSHGHCTACWMSWLESEVTENVH